MMSAKTLQAMAVVGQSARMAPADRAAVNRMILAGQIDAARCVERLICDGCVVTSVTIGGHRPLVRIMPPFAETGLWTDAEIRVQNRRGAPWTDTWAAVRFGCQIEWTVEVKA